MGISKLQAAELEIIAAVRLLFGGSDAVPVYVLAASAREITTTLCEKRGIRSFFDDARELLPNMSKKEMYREAHRHAAFFKHANNDPDGVLSDFTPSEADMVLFVACYDFGLLCGGKSIEAQVFEGWFMTLYGSPTDVPLDLDKMFPNLRARPRFDQVALGGSVLKWARGVPDFKMSYSLAPRPASPPPASSSRS